MFNLLKRLQSDKVLYLNFYYKTTGASVDAWHLSSSLLSLVLTAPTMEGRPG